MSKLQESLNLGKYDSVYLELSGLIQKNYSQWFQEFKQDTDDYWVNVHFGEFSFNKYGASKLQNWITKIDKLSSKNPATNSLGQGFKLPGVYQEVTANDLIGTDMWAKVEEFTQLKVSKFQESNWKVKAFGLCVDLKDHFFHQDDEANAMVFSLLEMRIRNNVATLQEVQEKFKAALAIAEDVLALKAAMQSVKAVDPMTCNKEELEKWVTDKLEEFGKKKTGDKDAFKLLKDAWGAIQPFLKPSTEAMALAMFRSQIKDLV